MRVRVRVFSALRSRFGSSEVEVEVPDNATGAELLDLLVAEHPSFAPYRSIVRLAVNRRYTPEDVELGEDDEVALITPVSGG